MDTVGFHTANKCSTLSSCLGKGAVHTSDLLHYCNHLLLPQYKALGDTFVMQTRYQMAYYGAQQVYKCDIVLGARHCLHWNQYKFHPLTTALFVYPGYHFL